MTTPIKLNEYGNVDVRIKVPDGLVHIVGKHIGQTLRRNGIRFAPALVGFKGSGKRWKPDIDGVVVDATQAKSAVKLVNALLAGRSSRRVKAKAAMWKRRRRAVEQSAADILEEFPSMPWHTAESIAEWYSPWCYTCDDDEEYDRAKSSTFYKVRAWARHNSTEYDDLLRDGIPRDEARQMIRKHVDLQMEQWAAPKQQQPQTQE